MKSIDAGTVVLLDYHESGHNVSIEKGYRIIREWTCEHCNREIRNKSMTEGMDMHAKLPLVNQTVSEDFHSLDALID